MAALSLTLHFPNEKTESITAKVTDTGLTLASLLLPLKSLYNLSDKIEIRKSDGSCLDSGLTLKEQGLYNGSSLFFKEPTIVQIKKAHDNSVIPLEDFLDSQREEIPDDPLSYPREDRECKARYLKDQANEALKIGKLHAALEGYSLAISWLPPEDSDEHLAGALFSNRSLVHIKLKDWLNARDDADQAFKLCPDNVKAVYRRGLAEKELGDRDDALVSFRAAVKKDPHDRTARAALTSLQAEIAALKAKTCEQTEEIIPEAIKWRLAQVQKGYVRPQVAREWQHSIAQGLQQDAVANGIRHVFRRRPAMEVFFCDCLAATTSNCTHDSSGEPHVLVLGAGCGVAVSLCARLAVQKKLASMVVLEPSALLVEHCRRVVAGFAKETNLDNVEVSKSDGQLDNEYVFTEKAFKNPISESDMANDSVLLVCDRLCEDLLGEYLISTFAAALEATKRLLPSSAKVTCIPSRAELICAPLELRCAIAAGCDVSKINALRFSASGMASSRVPLGARSWQCRSCGWLNHPSNKRACESCRAEKPAPGLLHYGDLECQSRGWWPLSLDDNLQADVRLLCACEQVVHTFDFDKADDFSLQRRVRTKTLEFKATCNAKINAMAVWWRLQGAGGNTLSTSPCLAGLDNESEIDVQQAVYYFGFEMGVTEGELLKFNVDFADNFSHVTFDLMSPQLTERMGLVKVEVPVKDLRTVHLLEKSLDLNTNRLTSPIPELDLFRNDKLLQFGPFDLVPGAFETHLWRKLEDRIRLHAERPRPGDKPMTCIFRRGAFEGTVRWPVPSMAKEAAVPRLPSYFEMLSDAHCWPYVEALQTSLSQCSDTKPRVLEIGCGPVPLFAMCAARLGARSWAVEMLPQLRELAAETVRDNGLEMIFQYKGYSNYSFFGSQKKPEDPSVRVMKAMPSTSLHAGVTPKFLDGGRAHVITCAPDDGALGEDYLITMWHAAEELLEPGGDLVPSSLCIKVMPVQWFPISCDGSSFLYSCACAGLTVQASRLDALTPLCKSPQKLFDIDLTSRPACLPSIDAEIVVELAGTLTGIAFWHEPLFAKQPAHSDDVYPYAMVHLLSAPRAVVPAVTLRVSASFKDHCLQLREIDD